MRSYRLYVGASGEWQMAAALDGMVGFYEKLILPLVTRYFPGATLSAKQGVWQGNIEPSLVVEVIDEDGKLDTALQLAEELRQAGDQNEVLVTVSPVEVHTVVRHTLGTDGPPPEAAA